MQYSNLSASQLKQITTLGELKAAGYKSRSIKEELRENLIEKLRKKEKLFEGILGYEETVIPDMERAILSRHNINLLGLRGQAKTRMARQMTSLLDEYIPYISGSELLEDPLNPLSYYGREIIEEKGDQTPLAWLHREERYTEKLATPDVSVADLIGDVDPIKAAILKLPYSDERVIHYGLVPRSNRCIFVINELSDLQPRIQVALFNILQEGDIQIRGFKLRLPLDIQFVFTANPEDYTNRGSIVTPLKDRIDSQIITHYPLSVTIGKSITEQEADITPVQKESVSVNETIKDLIEQIAFEARNSEYVDAKSGVSARLTISAYENLISAAERRNLINGDSATFIRVADLIGVIPAITGKIELVYEGEQEGAGIVAQNLLGKALRTQFVQYFPDPKPANNGKEGRKEVQNPQPKKASPYQSITDWFGEGHSIDVLNDAPDEEYSRILMGVPGLEELVKKHLPKADNQEKLFFMEFALHGLAEYSMLSKRQLSSGTHFGDLLSSMFTIPGMNDFEEDDY